MKKMVLLLSLFSAEFIGTEADMADINTIYQFIKKTMRRTVDTHKSPAQQKYVLHKFHINCLNGRNGELRLWGSVGENNPGVRDLDCSGYRQLLYNMLDEQKSGQLSFFSKNKNDNIEKDLLVMMKQDYK